MNTEFINQKTIALKYNMPVNYAAYLLRKARESGVVEFKQVRHSNRPKQQQFIYDPVTLDKFIVAYEDAQQARWMRQDREFKQNILYQREAVEKTTRKTYWSDMLTGYAHGLIASVITSTIACVIYYFLQR